MAKTHIHSEQNPCAKCLKKYGKDLTDWQPCANCPWISKQIDLTKPRETLSDEAKKQCIACQELIDFLEPEPNKYLCGKVKCLRNYIIQKSKERNK
jgi:hypothetical protein